MKFVVASDLQLHQYKHFAKFTDGVSSRLKDGLGVLKQIRRFCLSKDVFRFIFLGDLFQVRDFVDVTTFNLAYDEIERFGKGGIECFLLAGNHDQLLRTGITGSLRSFRNVATVIYEPTVCEVEDFRFCFIPFTEDTESIKKLVEKFAELGVGSEKKFLFLHCSIDGAVVLGDYVMRAPLKLENLLPESFNQVFLGHYHIPQVLSGNVRYVGAPMDLNFGEEGYDKGVIFVDTDVGTKFVKSAYPRFIEVSREELEAGKVDLESLKGHYVRVKGKGEVSEKVSEELLGKGIVFEQELEKEYEALKRLPLDLSMDLKNMIRLYVGGNVIDTTGLDIEKLVKLGEGFLEQVRI